MLLKDEMARKLPHMKKKIIFHQDQLMETIAKLNEVDFTLLPYPPYTPDLPPTDYWIFSDLKKCSRFDTNEVVITATGAYFKNKHIFLEELISSESFEIII